MFLLANWDKKMVSCIETKPVHRLSSPAHGCVLLRTHWLLFLVGQIRPALHPLPLKLGVFQLLRIDILCIQLLFKLGVSIKEHLRCGIVTGHIMFCFSFLHKLCFSKFSMIKAEQGRMSLLIGQLGTNQKADKRWIQSLTFWVHPSWIWIFEIYG